MKTRASQSNFRDSVIPTLRKHSLAFTCRAVAVLGGVAAQADILPILPVAAAARWQAIGVVNAEGAVGVAQCTGTLVAADLVLTAAHCVRGSVDTDAPLYFVLGGIGAEAPPVYRAANADIHPAYPTREGIDRFRVDLAVIHLEEPVSQVQARPVELAVFDPLHTGELAILAFHRLRPLGLNGRFDCPRVPLPRKDELHLACHVISGNSGAPAMYQQDDIWQITGVVTASLNAGSVHHALVAPLDQWVVDQVRDAQKKLLDD